MPCRCLVGIWLVGCGAPVVTPVAAPARPAAPPAPTLSFLERTSPHPRPKDVPHVLVKVTRREGPDSLEWSLPNVERVAEGCYLDHVRDALSFGMTDHDYLPFTLTMDTRADGTVSDVVVEPTAGAEPDVLMCLLRALGGQPLHLDKTPRHIVLGFAAHVWWST